MNISSQPVVDDRVLGVRWVPVILGMASICIAGTKGPEGAKGNDYPMNFLCRLLP